MKSPYILLWLFLTIAAHCQDTVLPGEGIFLKGEGRDPITAHVGQTAVEVPATVMPCAGCHGSDGRGRPEGGMNPSDITWNSLTRPYTITTTEGRSRPPYNPETLIRAITRGVDSANNPLDWAMPRYQMSPEDAQDLVAFLKVMQQRKDPGLYDDHVRIGVLLAPQNVYHNHNQRVIRVLNAVANDTNQRGGIFSRRLELIYTQPQGTPAQRLESITNWLTEEKPFILLAAFLPGLERELPNLARNLGLPIIGTYTLDPKVDSPPNPYVFHLAAGLSDQANVLVSHQNKAPLAATTAIVHDGSHPAAVTTILDAYARMQQFNTPMEAFLNKGGNPAQLAHRLHKKGVSVIYYLGIGEQEAAKTFWRSVGDLDWSPKVLAPGMLADQALTALIPYLEQVVLAYPSSPSDRTFLAQQQYQRLATGTHLPQQPGTVETTALAAFTLTTEAFTRIGRDLRRDTLIQELEKLYAFETGYLPPLSYNPNKRIGARGAHLLTYNKDQKQWVPLGNYRPGYP